MVLPSVCSASRMAPPTARAGSARGHPVSSRGRIERHGAHKVTEDRGRSRGLRREPVRGAACQSGMHQFRLVQWHSPRGLESDNARDSGVLGPCGTSKQGSWEDAIWGGAGAHSATRRGGGQDHPHRITHTGQWEKKCLGRTTGSPTSNLEHLECSRQPHIQGRGAIRQRVLFCSMHRSPVKLSSKIK